MIGELGQSHMLITGPGAEAADRRRRRRPASARRSRPGPATDAIGEPGLTVRVIEGRPTITRVRAGSSAEHAGLAPGYVVTHIAGTAAGARRAIRPAPLRPVEERFALRRAAQHRLLGPRRHAGLGRLPRRPRSPRQGGPGPRSAARAARPPRPPAAALPRGARLRGRRRRRHRVQHLPAAAGAGRHQEGDGALRRPPRPRRRARSAGQSGRPGRDGDPDRVAVRRASRCTLGTLNFRDFGQTFTRAAPSWGRSRSPGPLAILTDEGTRVGVRDARGRAARGRSARSSSATRRWARCCRRWSRRCRAAP